jgi:peroxiredoxin
MKRNITGRMLAAAIGAGLAAYALVAFATLKPGDRAPAFVAQASLGGNVYQYSLADALKKGPVVLYFFPAAFTSGCTAEAHAFAEAAAEFKKQGATLVGLTAGNAERIQEFTKVECRDKFPVGLATPSTISGYDVALPQKAGWTNRTSYVIGRNGKIVYVLSAMEPLGHITGTLDAVKALKAHKG